MMETDHILWQEYNDKVQMHEKFCNDYGFFLDRILRHLEWVRPWPSNTWTTDEIRNVISSEIDRARSMDAPNKPGYYRANND